MRRHDIAILYHNYYSLQGLEDIRERTRRLAAYNPLLLTSLADKFSLEGRMQNTEDEKFVFASNKGKDIGGKLILVDLLLKLYPDIPYVVFLHDKRSYQKYSGDFEKENLFRIIEPQNTEKTLAKFTAEPRTGIICKKGAVRNEFVSTTGTFNTPNSAILAQMTSKYGLETKDHGFVAGTMFWIRTSLLANFFTRHSPASIRATLESGNVLDAERGTVTHSWERMLCWIATSANYKIEGI